MRLDFLTLIPKAIFKKSQENGCRYCLTEVTNVCLQPLVVFFYPLRGVFLFLPNPITRYSTVFLISTSIKSSVCKCAVFPMLARACSLFRAGSRPSFPLLTPSFDLSKYSLISFPSICSPRSEAQALSPSTLLFSLHFFFQSSLSVKLNFLGLSDCLF